MMMLAEYSSAFESIALYIDACGLQKLVIACCIKRKTDKPSKYLLIRQRAIGHMVVQSTTWYGTYDHLYKNTVIEAQKLRTNRIKIDALRGSMVLFVLRSSSPTPPSEDEKTKYNYIYRTVSSINSWTSRSEMVAITQIAIEMKKLIMEQILIKMQSRSMS